jgi:dTMP kinase
MKLITFEGIEGVGKSTQINLSKDWLESKGHTVLLLREPGSTKFGESVREILLSKDSNISFHTELLLMFSARSEMIRSHFNDSAADFILCDRYYHASIAYQGYGRGLSLELIHSLITGLNCPKPDLTFIYDLDVALGFARKSGDNIDRIESSGLDFFERVRKGYIALSKSEPEVHLINADSSAEDIHSKSIHLIQSQLKL